MSRRQRLGLYALVPVLVTLWWLPLPLPPAAHALAAVFAAVVVAWVSECIPIQSTALLIAPAMVAAGVCDAKAAFAPYADPILFVFVGAFMLAKALARHGVDARIAAALLQLAGQGQGIGRLQWALLLTTLLLSAWVSNTATAALMLPIVAGLYGTDGPHDDSDAPPAVTRHTDLHRSARPWLAIAYAASVGGLATPVGSPPNLITLRLLTEGGHTLSFFDWMLVGVPAAVLLLGLVAWRTWPQQPAAALQHTETPAGDLPPPVAQAAQVSKQPHTQGGSRPWTRPQRISIAAFAMAIFGWLLPGLLKVLGRPEAAIAKAHLPAGAVALWACLPLFLLRQSPAEKEVVLPWREAVRIDWGVILLFGGGLSLGQQMLKTGLAQALARAAIHQAGVQSLWGLTAAALLFTLFFTELCSNTASAGILVPIVLAIAQGLGVSPVPPALAVGLGASCAFMLPIATGPNAIVYGSGRVDLAAMARSGIVLNLLAATALWLLLRLLCPLLGWS